MKINPIQIAEIAIDASKIALKHYGLDDIEVKTKEDRSPVTAADIEVNEFITKNLTSIAPSIPVVSEEDNQAINLDIIRNSELFWLVDPIDGTWSFINKNGVFVINIALIKNGYPILGIINSPLHGSTYYNLDDKVYKIENSASTLLKPQRDFSKGLDFLVSDINLCQRSQDFLGRYKVKTVSPVPSAYKFALMAEGQGDIYPRFKPTFSWDTASGHALLKAVGGEIFAPNATPLKYNHTLKNPNFVAVVDTKIKVDEF
ncbi:MAG: 3(2),5-bisphosphate nucleotidase [Candidatus Midichloriaceae bacterium]|jgi:3'(2'), 5'-bisphosphate nucleotidase|nr:3(2),5-bisphosphate nucleotidase [Candidatus Midichloriaceae bacterium]